jgi:chromatin remodeling complex protein RSC6
MKSLYQSIRSSLTPKIIKKSFEQRYIWPFNGKKFNEAALEWAGVYNEETTDARAVLVQDIVNRTQTIKERQQMLEKEELSVVSGRVKHRAIFTYDEMLENAENKEKEAQEKQEQTMERKRQREEDKSAKEAAKIARTEARNAKKAKKIADEKMRRCQGGCGNSIRKNQESYPTTNQSGLLCHSCYYGKQRA